MDQFSGAPGVKDSITELGFIPGGGNLGKICIQIPTKRGKRGKHYLIGTWTEFLNTLGGIHPDDRSALVVREALNRGAKFRITRAFHYTNPDQISTADGTAATVTNTVTPVSEVLAQGSFTITGGTSGPGVNKIDAVLVNGIDILGAPVDWATSHNATATAVALAITNFTSTPNYTASAVGAVVTITAVAGSGATPNGFVVNPTEAGDVTTGSIVNMAGGVTQVVGGDTDWEAIEVGNGYNGTVISVTQSADNNPANVDITVTLPDAVNTFVVKSIAKATTAQAAIDVLNKKLEAAGCQVKITGVTTAIQLGSVTLISGAQNISQIVDADVIGSSAGKTGWYAFDDVVDSMRVWNIAYPNPAVNQGLADYCQARKDMRGMGRFPLGLSIQGLNDYRDGDGIYNHSPIDSFYFDLVYSDVFINNPADANDTMYEVTGMGHLAAARTKADDKKGPWWSIGEESYNKLSGINDVAINLAAGGNSTQWDTLYEKGVNAIVNDETQKIIFVGNRTTLLNKNSLLSKLNIADFVIYAARVLRQIAKKSNFKPNDIRMFNELYRRVRPTIVNQWVKGRAIEGAGPNDGEGVWWHWIGDQFAKDLNDLKWNNKNDVDAGGYKVRFAFKPIASNEYIVIDLAPADSVTILNISVLTDPFNQ